MVYSTYLVFPATVVAKRAAFLAQMLWVDLGLVTHVQTIWLLQRPLLMRKDIDPALDALLAVVSPRVAAHPLALAFGTLVLPEASLLALVRSQTFAFRTGLRTITNIMPLLKAQMAHVCRRGRSWWSP